MLRPVDELSGRRTRRNKGPRMYVRAVVAPDESDDVDDARVRDTALGTAAVRGPYLRSKAVSRNDWFTAAILAEQAADADLEPYLEHGESQGDLAIVAARVAMPVRAQIDHRRARLSRRRRDVVPQEQYLAAVVRWALDQPPGVVAAQLVNVPRRDHRATGQQVLEVFVPQAM
jgi:hypothetical protein